jgi:membrane protease YdiL (CAAX protease family)
MNGDVLAADDGATLPAATLLAAALAGFIWSVTAIRRRLARGEAVVPLRPHEPVPWSGADVVGIVAAYLLAAVVATTMVPESAPLVRRLSASSLVTLVVAAASAGWLARRGADAAALGLAGDRWREDLGLALGSLGLVVFPLLTLAGLLNLLVPYKHHVVDLLAKQRDPWTVAVVVVSAVVVAPLAEEFFFRRVLQGWLEKRMAGDAAGPVLFSSLAFAAAHAGQGLAYVPLFPFAIVLGVIARQTGSIVPCVLLHALFNSVSVALLLGQGPVETG